MTPQEEAEIRDLLEHQGDRTDPASKTSQQVSAESPHAKGYVANTRVRRKRCARMFHDAVAQDRARSDHGHKE